MPAEGSELSGNIFEGGGGGVAAEAISLTLVESESVVDSVSRV